MLANRGFSSNNIPTKQYESDVMEREMEMEMEMDEFRRNMRVIH